MGKEDGEKEGSTTGNTNLNTINRHTHLVLFFRQSTKTSKGNTQELKWSPYMQAVHLPLCCWLPSCDERGCNNPVLTEPRASGADCSCVSEPGTQEGYGQYTNVYHNHSGWSLHTAWNAEECEKIT